MAEPLAALAEQPEPIVIDLDAITCGGDDLLAIERRSAPSVGVARSRCTGAALAVAMSVDLLVCAPHTTFGLPGEWSPWVLRRGEGIMGRRAVGYLVMTGRVVSAEVAQEWGLVSYISSEPSSFAYELAENLRSRSSVAIRTIMAQAHRGAAEDFTEVRATTGLPLPGFD